MSGRSVRCGAGLTALLGTVLVAGCGSASSEPPAAPPAATVPLATAMTVAGGETWAVVAMGGSAADENRFWEDRKSVV